MNDHDHDDDDDVFDTFGSSNAHHGNLWTEVRIGSSLVHVHTSDGRELSGRVLAVVEGWVQIDIAAAHDRRAARTWLNMDAIVTWTLQRDA